MVLRSLRGLLLGLGTVVLAGCGLSYEVRISQSVKPDGRSIRTLSFKEERNRTHERFEAPSAPYETVSDDTVIAELPLGTSASGWNPFVEYADTSLDKGVRALRGEVTTTTEDVLIGKCVHYRETLLAGEDPDRFLRALPKWLSTGVDLLVRSTKKLAPELDEELMAAYLRKKYVPELLVALPELRRRLVEAVRRSQNESLSWDIAHFDDVFDYLEQCAGNLGLRCLNPALRSTDTSGYLNERNWEWNGFLQAEFAALGLSTERATSLAAAYRGQELQSAFDEVVHEIYPDRSQRNARTTCTGRLCS